MESTQDLISLLNLSGKKLSKSHRRIAEYIVQHYDKAVFMTAAALGEAVGVSESTVVRFAMALGYEGPVLLIHGTEDENVPVSVVYVYQDIYGDKMELQLIEGSNHQYSSLYWKQKVYDLTIGFIRKQIGA